jgi:hypothetical protein
MTQEPDQQPQMESDLNDVHWWLSQSVKKQSEVLKYQQQIAKDLSSVHWWLEQSVKKQDEMLKLQHHIRVVMAWIIGLLWVIVGTANYALFWR